MEFATNDPRVNLFDAVAAARPTMTVDFVTPITDIASAKAWIEALYAAEMLFHFEDSPTEIGNRVNVEWVPLWTPEQAKLVAARRDELYDLDWSEVGHECPIGYALEVMKRDETK